MQYIPHSCNTIPSIKMDISYSFPRRLDFVLPSPPAIGTRVNNLFSDAFAREI